MDYDGTVGEVLGRKKGGDMIAQPRVDLLKSIKELSHRYPNWRLGQLIANIAGWADQEIWDVEDEELLAAVQLHLQQINRSETVLRS